MSLKKAQSISLTIDDKKPFTAVMFKASLDGPELTTTSGLLYVQKASSGKDIDWFDQDHAERQRDFIVDSIQKFCFSMDGKLDDHLFKHMLSRIRVITVDAVLLKTVEFLKDRIPGLVLVPW